MPHFSTKSYQAAISLFARSDNSLHNSNSHFGSLKSDAERTLQNNEQSPDNIAAQQSAWMLSRLSALEGKGDRAMHYAQICANYCQAAGLHGADKIYLYDALSYAHQALGHEDESHAYRQLLADVSEILA